MGTFSALERQATFDRMADESFDLLVIGGGITGAGIALDAATRGLKVALVEMQDFASGTSSRSTKLVHGGLRYLKQFEIKEVAELGKERAIVYENGPHVTTPEWMLLPFHKGGTFGKLSTSFGLRVYDFLAGVKKQERRTMLSLAETIRKVPIVKKDGLLGGGVYVEYRTDDARLTMEVIKAAVENGAVITNYAKAAQFIYDDREQVIGADIKDMLTDKTVSVQAKKIVNATGPWVDDVREMDGSKSEKHLILSKGVHLVFDQSTFPLQQAVYFDTPDKRMVFAIPRDGKTYVGTTDTFYDASRATIKITTDDRAYIMGAIHYMFPDLQIAEKDIESGWAGIRPLIHEEGKSPSEISRKDEIWQSDTGLITIAGGKLTGYRKMAETVVSMVVENMAATDNKQFGPCVTKHFPISGGDVGGSARLQQFLYAKNKQAQRLGLNEQQGLKLAKMYGSNVDTVFGYVEVNDTLLPPVLYAQLMYAIHHEMAVKPTDFFIRRTGALLFDIATVMEWKEQVMAEMATTFGWTTDQQTRYAKELQQEIVCATTAVEV
ncbi:glycerol-3-phosphate dehydrogenase/oxidase [Sporosarcina beigongshangi]|uniref:glycerol-3-phosphate dehydrogenase/oxidase n=1 Tax=Sporosarcina beigongshangi TaxID=2782538 RepID=UPI001939E3E6|nr:glycerol-3-phosphate dehydrogenase/oxidase [Sporosarcina beigongshangi]